MEEKQGAPPQARWGRPPGPTVERSEEGRKEHAKELRHGQYERRRFSELTTIQLLQRLGAELAAKKEVRRAGPSYGRARAQLGPGARAILPQARVALGKARDRSVRFQGW